MIHIKALKSGVTLVENVLVYDYLIEGVFLAQKHQIWVAINVKIPDLQILLDDEASGRCWYHNRAIKVDSDGCFSGGAKL